MAESKWLAHIAEDGRTQTVLEHLKGTAALAEAFAAPFGAAEVASLAGMAHDIGKYSEEFQQRLHGGPVVDHANAGAFECFRHNQAYAAFAVSGHHTGLPNAGTRGDTANDSTLAGHMAAAATGKLPDYRQFAQEVKLPEANHPAFCNRAPLTDAFFVRMLYSCLVDADYLDTEAFMTGVRVTEYEALPTLLEKLKAYIAPWFPPKGDLNKRRCEILRGCLQHGEEDHDSIYTLTVPTGGGKTVASLAFSLQHAVTASKRRIIYVIPYTSIIEQTAAVFREILGDEQVLEHHSGVIFCDADYLSGKAVWQQQAAENWDAPVIVTTSVQFFESLYASRSSRCRKLHNLADSVIIFDEAQMLPVQYLKPCVHAIAELTAHYGATAVLCTATQPALGNVFREFLQNYQPTELCDAQLANDPVFRRVHYERVGEKTWRELAAEINSREQVLCVVNSRKNAETLFNLLKGDGIYHLSTLMCPAHRQAKLAEIRQKLKDGLPCRVVSTALIEAGVDVDFPAVYREMAGLDSILQAAGRCNREGKRTAEQSTVTVFKAETPPPALFAPQIGAAAYVLSHYEDFTGADAIHTYFRELLDLKGPDALDLKRILPLLSESLAFRTAAERFKLIDSDTRTVYIPVDEGTELVQRYLSGERSRRLYRQLSRWSVSIYPQHFAALCDAGVLNLLDDETAILEDTTLYSDCIGLTLSADSGKALFI